MKNLLEYTFCSDGTGSIELTDGRILDYSDAFIVDANRYIEFLHWEKDKIENLLKEVYEEIDNQTKKVIELNNKRNKLIKEIGASQINHTELLKNNQ